MLDRGYLLMPEQINGKLPGVVAMHSTSDFEMLHISGAKEGKIVPFGYRLAKIRVQAGKNGIRGFLPPVFSMEG